MIIYITGQITGLDIKVAENYFETIENELVKNGHLAVNPCKILPYNPKHTWEDYMVEDFRALLPCDAILMLDNWTNSKGAKVEHAIAVAMDKKVFYSKNHDLF